MSKTLHSLRRGWPAASLFLLATTTWCQAAAEVKMEASAEGFIFEKIPAPAINDAGAEARWKLVDGEQDNFSADTAVLADGTVPQNEDDPRANFFLSGTTGGKLVADLGETTEIESVGSYSCHPRERADQLYRLYGSTGTAGAFKIAPPAGSDPKQFGWTLLATVDTRSASQGKGGRVGVEIGGERSRGVGRFRYLLFDIAPPVKAGATSNTFFSEIDVVAAGAKETLRLHSNKKVVREYETKDGKYQFVVDASQAPDMVPWVEKELIPMCEEWYPKLNAMLPSKGYEGPEKFSLTFKSDMPDGVPAYAAGDGLSLSADFFRREKDREAKGCVVHEMVHVVQNYGYARQVNRHPKDTPVWVTEGIADYVRWFLYEPESKGAEITEGNIGSARYDGSYRITANFFHYIAETYDPRIIPEMNAACREGRYDEELWKKWTGKPLQELGADWLAAQRKRLHLRH
ncbi:basic secretory protein-like protein [Haloferula sargassicola]|uniref:Plant Basic Secretory Protein n=1 Tax=Haloferula sargassicola TaxID=490096 RepID=A0ABP9UPE1_9BACT